MKELVSGAVKFMRVVLTCALKAVFDARVTVFDIGYLFNLISLSGNSPLWWDMEDAADPGFGRK